MKERSSSKNLGSPEGRNSRKREESITNEDEERKHKRRRQSRDSSSSSSSSSSCSSSSSDSSSDSDKDDKKRKRSKKDKKKDKKKERKKMKKEKKRLKKLLKKEKKKLKKEKKKEQGSSAAVREIPESKSPEQSEDKELETHLLEASRARAPMTKEEWEKQQSVIRRVYDPDTGRHRIYMNTMEWSHEKSLNLIELYKSKPELWQVKNKFYYKKIKKQNAWNAISNDIGSPVAVIKAKMNSMLSSFRREKAKILQSVERGKDRDEIYRSNWFAFHAFQFLMNKNSQPNLSTKHEEIAGIELVEEANTLEEIAIENTEEVDIVSENIQTSSPKTSSPKTSSSKTSSSKTSSMKTSSPETSFPETSSSITSSPKTSSPKTSSSKTSSPKTSSPKTSSPKTSSPKTSSPKTSSPKTSTPKTSTNLKLQAEAKHSFKLAYSEAKKRKQETSETKPDPNIVKALDILQTCSQRDACDVYGEHIALKLKKYTNHTRIVVQHLVNNIIFKADMGQYDKEANLNVSYVSSTAPCTSSTTTPTSQPPYSGRINSPQSAHANIEHNINVLRDTENSSTQESIIVLSIDDSLETISR